MARPNSKAGASSFRYVPRTREQMQKRAQQQGGTREGYLIDEVKIWTAAPGDHRVRILPPTWKGAEHYGLDVYAHYGIGTEGSTFICLANPPEGYKPAECPCCEERARAQDAGEEELADRLRPNKRVLAWIIDRDKEHEGPMIWPMPWTVDKDLANISVDARTEEVYPPDDPDEGFDISFRRDGQGMRTKYSGLQLDRRPSPLADDERDQDKWLQYVIDNPLPDCVVVHEPEKVAKELQGGVRMGGEQRPSRDPRDRDSRDKDDEPRRRPRRDEDEQRPRQRVRSRNDEDGESPRSRAERVRDAGNGDARRRSARRQPEEYSYEDLSGLSDEELVELADQHNIELDDRADLLPQLCEAFDIEMPRRPARGRLTEPAEPPARQRARIAAKDNEPEDDRPRGRARMSEPPARGRAAAADEDEDTRGSRTAEGSRTARIRESLSRLRGSS